MSTKIKSDGTVDKVLAGHTNSGKDDSHLYRPTVELFLDLDLLVGHFDNTQRPYWLINKDNKEFAYEIKEATIEGALGISRQVLK